MTRKFSLVIQVCTEFPTSLYLDDVFKKRKFTVLLRCVTGLNPQVWNGRGSAGMACRLAVRLSGFPFTLRCGAPLIFRDPPIPNSAAYLSSLQRSVQRASRYDATFPSVYLLYSFPSNCEPWSFYTIFPCLPMLRPFTYIYIYIHT